MKLALHRSIAFWSGMLVMAFICWAWRDSYLNNTIVEYKRFVGQHWAGGFRMSLPDYWPSPELKVQRRAERISKAQVFPEAVFEKGGDVFGNVVDNNWI